MAALPWAIPLSFVGAAAAAIAGRRSASAARAVALATALLTALAVGVAAAGFRPGLPMQTLGDLPWIPQMGIRFHLAADGISLSLAVLTALASLAAILFSWNIEGGAGGFFALLLTLIGGVYGVFLSADAFALFVFYEIAIIPKYFLIARWGGAGREYGAMKLVLYSFAGSALVLAGLLGAYAACGHVSFGLEALAAQAQWLPRAQQIVLFALMFLGFAVLAGLFPFHTWAPTGHVAAPTGASMLLAGVVMKLGAYGCLRVALPFFPLGFEFWRGWIGALAVIGIVYAALVALVQSDFKFVIGYSSVSHMGFVLLGLAAADFRALSGAVLQMFSHGVLAGLLFAVVGRMVYDRTHTRQLAELNQMGLHRWLPFASAVFVIAGLGSMGLPGLSGFPAEWLVLVGAWEWSPISVLAAVIGVLIGAAFVLRAMQTAFFGRGDQAPEPPWPPISWPEKIGAGLLLVATVAVGLKPGLLLNWIEPALRAPYFHAVISAAAR